MVSKFLTLFQITIAVVFAVSLTLIFAHSASAQQAVVVVGSPAPEIVTNTLKNTITSVASGLSAKNLEALILKEFSLDALARNQAQKLQQQLVADTLKMLGGQLPGQNGKIPFIQDYGEHYQNVIDEAVAGVIFGDELVDQCSERRTYQTRAIVYNWYLEEVRSNGSADGTSNQCQTDADSSRRSLDKILIAYDSCKDGICAGLKGQNKAAQAAVNAIDISNRENVDGYFPVKVCTSNEGGGQDCKITSPASLLSDSVSFTLGELPGLQLLNVNELNEIVSGFMSNLTNQAISGITGVLGLSGNSDYSSNVFGPGGNLSYADALANDDISQYQSNQKNPIKEAIKNEAKYKVLQTKILTEITALETKLAKNKSDFPGCFDLKLTTKLATAKTNAISNLEISSTTSAILALLDSQYDNATDPSVKNAVIGTFIQYQSEGYFRTELENQDLELSYINYELAEMVDKFKYETASAKADCGGKFDYDGILTKGSGND